MTELEQIKQRYPDATRGLTDYEIVDKLSKASNRSQEAVAFQLGVQAPNDPGFWSTVRRSGGQMAAGAGELYGDVTGYRDNAVSTYARGVTQRNPSGINSLEDIKNDPWLAVKEAAGQGLTFIGPQVGLRAAAGGAQLLGKAAAARALSSPITVGGVGMVSSALPSLSSIGEAQRRKGIDDAPAKYLGAGLVGGIEQLGGPQAMLLRGVPKATAKTYLGRVAQIANRAGIGELGEEVLQTPIERTAGYDQPFNEEGLRDMAFGGAMGYIGGAALGLPVGVVQGVNRDADGKEPPPAADPNQPDPNLLKLPNLPQADFYVMPDGSLASHEEYNSYLGGLRQPGVGQARDMFNYEARDVVNPNVVSSEAMLAADLPETRLPPYNLRAQDAPVDYGPAPVQGKLALPEPMAIVPDQGDLFGYPSNEPFYTRAKGLGLALAEDSQQPTSYEGGIDYTQPERTQNGTETSNQEVQNLRQDQVQLQGQEQGLLALQLKDGSQITAADLGITTQKRLEAFGIVVDAHNNGIIDDEEAKWQADRISATKKIGEVVALTKRDIDRAARVIRPPEKLEAGTPLSAQEAEDYKARAAAYLLQYVTPDEKAALELVRGLEKQQPDGTVELDSKSLREAARKMRVSHEAMRNRADRAVDKIQDMAKQAGYSMEAAYTFLDMASDNVYQAPVITEAQAAQEGLTYRRGDAQTRSAEQSDDATTDDEADVEDSGPVDAATQTEELSKQDIQNAVDAWGLLYTAVTKKGELFPTLKELSEELLYQFARDVRWIATNVTSEQLYFTQMLVAADKIRKAVLINEINQENDAVSGLSERAGLPTEDSPVTDVRQTSETEVTSEPAAEPAAQEVALSEEQRQAELAKLAAEQQMDARTAYEAEESSNEFQDARAELDELSLDPEITKKRLLAFAERLRKRALVSDAQLENYRRVAKDTDMGAEDIIYEIDLDLSSNHGAVFSGAGAPVSEASTIDRVKTELKKYFLSGDKFNRLVTVVQTASEIPKNIRDTAGITSTNEGSVQAFVSPSGQVYIIAGNIDAGQEVAVFMHEVGVHIGLEKMLGGANMLKLARQVAEWAQKNDGSLESEIARTAVKRINYASASGLLDKQDEAVVTQEMIAYFIEEAVGTHKIDPVAATNISSGLRQWFAGVLRALKNAVRKLGISPSILTAQDIVDIAYGAANIELSRSEVPYRASPYLMSATGASDVVNAMSPRVYDTWLNIKDKLSKLNPKLLSPYQLVDRFGGKLTSLVEHSRLIDSMTKTQQDFVQRSDQILTRWGTFASIHPKLAEALHNVMLSATLNQMHPDESYESENNSHLPKDSAEKRGIHKALADQYSALTPEAQAVYKDVKTMLADNWKLRGDIYAGVVDAAFKKELEVTTDPEKLKALKETIKKEKASHDKQLKKIRGPYFPLMRFGDLVVIAESEELSQLREKYDEEGGATLAKEVAKLEQDPKHYSVQSFEKASEANREKERLAKKFGTEPRIKRAEAYMNEMRPASFGQLELLDDLLEVSLGKEGARELQTTMRSAFLATLPEHAALQREIARKNISGASSDMLRSVAEAVSRDSFYLSRLQFMPAITANLATMRKQVKADVQLGDVYNTVRASMNMDFKYIKSPVASFLTSMSSFFHLGLAPSYLINNMTQPFMISIPQLAGRYGAGAASRAVATAWSDATKLIKQGRGGKFVSLDVPALDKVITNAGERAMVMGLLDLGKLDIAPNADTEVYATGADPRIKQTSRVLSWASHNIELVNRLSTALAAYRLEMKKSNGNQKLAEAKARETVELTQLDYSDTNAAYFMKAGHLGGWNRLPMQFRKYQQGMIFLLARNLQDAFRGDKEAARALLWLMGTQVVMTGVRGVPVVAPLIFLGGLAGDDDDEKGSLETKMRNYAADVLGEEGGRVLWKGLPAMLGLDASSLSMENLLSPLPMMRMNDVLDAPSGQESVETLLYNAAGAPVGLLGRLANAAVYAREGDGQKALEQALPKFLASPAKAVRIANEGVTTRSGNVAVEAEEIDIWDAAIKAAGFSPIVESEYYEALNAKEEVADAIRDRRVKVMRDYASARLKGEPVTEAMAAVQKFNKEHPSQAITYDTLLRSVQQRRNTMESRDAAGVSYRRNEDALRGITRFASGT